jgi:hypothetical protein
VELKKKANLVSAGVPITIITENQRSDLLKREPYKPRIFGLEGEQKTGLLMRVEDLTSFHNPELPIAIKLVAYQSDQDTWVICVLLRIMDLPQGTLVAAAYLNPRQELDYKLILQLSQQQIFPVVFLSEDVREYVAVPLSWSPLQREEASHIIDSINKNLTTHRLSGGFDPDFDTALVEFQEAYSLKNLLE